jgi:transcriptional regulator with XRE-family HTH domain
MERRLELNISQLELAKRLGYTSRSFVSRVECGTMPISKQALAKWAVALQTTAEYLLHMTDSIDGNVEEKTSYDKDLEGLIKLYSKMNEKERKLLFDFADTLLKNKMYKSYAKTKKSRGKVD